LYESPDVCLAPARILGGTYFPPVEVSAVIDSLTGAKKNKNFRFESKIKNYSKIKSNLPVSLLAASKSLLSSSNG